MIEDRNLIKVNEKKKQSMNYTPKQ